MEKEASLVWDTVCAMNRAWTEEGNAGKLNEYFHPDMVAVTPVDRERLVGRKACVEGWEQFTRAATIHRWQVDDPDVRLFGDSRFAVVTYYYDMCYEIGGRTVETGGRDMFVLAKEDGRWWVVADQFSPYPRPAGE